MSTKLYTKDTVSDIIDRYFGIKPTATKNIVVAKFVLYWCEFLCFLFIKRKYGARKNISIFEKIVKYSQFIPDILYKLRINMEWDNHD